MSRTLASLAILASIFTAAAALSAQPAAPAADVDTTQSERGRYLVHSVAMCVQCHSPRNQKGELRTDRLLTGGAVPVTNPFVGPRWAYTAPNLINLPGYTEEQFVTLLTTGIRPAGDQPRAPMPPFRMTAEDARAIWTYLRGR